MMKTGFTCGTFDLLHAGHILMFQDAANQCDRLVVGLQTDPSIDRPKKNKPIQSVEERKIQLDALRCVDEVIIYETETDLYSILESLRPDVRIIGSDWWEKNYTGCELEIPIYFHHRQHDYSTTNLRKRVKRSEGFMR